MFGLRGPSFVELTQQALSSTTEGYNLLAPKFDQTPFRTPDAVLEPIGELTGSDASVDTAVDLCCGTGAAMRMLRPKCRKSVTGIDASQGMLAEAARRLQDAPGDVPVRLIHDDVLEVSDDAAYDLATTFGSLGHIPVDRQRDFVRQIRGMLKPGGRFVFVAGPMPSVFSPRRWAWRTFNGLMHLRNALIDPPFVMFYLKFTLERARTLLGDHGFDLEVHAPYRGTRWSRLRAVVAHKSE